jgi:hypothetical protein
LDRWRGATDNERGDAFYGVLSVVAAMQGHLRPKPSLAVRFPKPYRQHVSTATEPCNTNSPCLWYAAISDPYTA